MSCDKNDVEALHTAGQSSAEQHVRVGYQFRDFGLALVIGRSAADRSGDGHRCCDEVTPCPRNLMEASDAVLRVGGTVRLEFETADGRPTVLAWDPAEVNWSALAA